MKKLLAILAACTLTVPMFAAVGCGEDKEDGDKKSDTLNLLDGLWGVNEDEESPYVISQSRGEPMTVTYEKTGSQWQYFKHNMGIYEAADFAGLKTLVIEGTFTTSSNDPRVTLAFEYVGDLAKQEVHFTMDNADGRYEWDISSLNVDKASRMLVFLEGNNATGSGTFKANKFEITKNDIDEKYNIVKTGPEVEVNTITATNKTANAGWYDNGDGVYTITKTGTDFKVDYDKKSSEWAIMKALVTGAAIDDFNSVKLTVQGTAGTELMVKPFDKVERRFILTGGVDDIIVDISGVADVDYTTQLPIFIFVAPGTKDVKGTFTIKNLEFTMDEIPAPEKEVNEITSTNTAVTGWYAHREGDYKLSVNNDGSLKATKTAAEMFNGLDVDVKGEALKTMKVFKVVVNGDFKNFKVECGNLLEAVEIRDKKGDVEINCKIKDLSNVDCTQPFTIRMFFNWDAENNGNGMSYTIKSAAFSDVYEEVNTVTADNKTANAGWYDKSPNGAYTITEGENGFVVNYDKKGEQYANMQAFVTGAALGDMKTVKITVKGTAGTTITLKPFDTCETKFTLTGGEDVFVVDISGVTGKDFASKLPVILFVDIDKAESTGTLTIMNLEFSTEAKA